MASPTPPTEGLVEVITNTPTNYPNMLWGALGALVLLPVVMWGMDFAREWFINHAERNAEMEDKKEERKVEREERKGQRKEEREDKKEEWKEKRLMEKEKLVAEKEIWEAEIKERQEMRQYHLQLKQLELAILQAQVDSFSACR